MVQWPFWTHMCPAAEWWDSSDFILELLGNMTEVRTFTSEELIHLVQGHPALWDKGDPQHSNNKHCHKLWTEIAKIFVEGFDAMDKKLQKKHVDKMKTKWRSLRDAYVKDLRQGQQEQRSGSGASNRTVYCYSTLLGFLRNSVEPRETEDSFREEQPQQPAEQHDTSSEELFDEEVLDPTFRPPTRNDSRRSSGSMIFMEDTATEVQDHETGEEPFQPGPSTEQVEQAPATEELRQQERRTTPTQRPSRDTERTRRRIPPGPVPTRRETEAEMSGAVSGLLGLLRSHEDLIQRQLQDGDRGNLIKQYQTHVESLQNELGVVHQHYQEEVKNVHEQYRAQLEQVQNHHQQSISILHQQMQQMQQQMQQLQQQNLDFVRQMSYPGYHTLMSLLPFLENVQSSRMMACHSSLLETVKSHMQQRSVTPTLTQWSSASQAYQGYRGTSFTQIPSGGSSSSNTPETPEFTTGAHQYSSEGK